jgi:oligoribonuclease NrnB/cAMP/cGMP phosphodiesterase (DHH superfamily)
MKCFYHRDLDGECSAAIIKYRFPECQLYSINYGEPFPWKDITDINEVIYMVDFSLQPFTDMMKLDSKSKLIWIDHHISAIKESLNYHTHYIPGIRDTTRSACQLTWKYLMNLSIPLSVDLLGLYDIWNHENPLVVPFQYAIRGKDTDPEKNLELWKNLFFTSERTIKDIARGGANIIKYEAKKNAEICKEYAFETYIGKKRNSWQKIYDSITSTTPPKYKAICLNIGKSGSSVFDSIWDSEKYDLMITFCRTKNNQWTLSLYSTKNSVDCSEIAKSYGGGGHFSAAGFQCKKLPFNY